MKQRRGPAHEHRSFVIISQESPSDLPSRDPVPPRSTTCWVVDDAFDRSGADPRRWVREERDSGVLLLIDASVWKVDIVGSFLDHLVAALAEYNTSRRPQDWLRLRIALHAGKVRRDEGGWSGDDLTMALRLNQAREVEKQLAAAARAQCIIVASDHIYRAIIRHEERVAWATHYRAIDLALLGEPIRAWIRIPGYQAPPGLPPSKPFNGSGEAARGVKGRVVGPDAGGPTGPPARPDTTCESTSETSVLARRPARGVWPAGARKYARRSADSDDQDQGDASGTGAGRRHGLTNRLVNFGPNHGLRPQARSLPLAIGPH